ncbi:SHOCT domain-containing protein [Hymenobacter sp. B1770]|uniref:SHOCT domain-containing protein n=1 Tax=Hymenobacter sp. B1770 TaxID=1718788 RepID=UPI003CEFCA2D
MENPSSPLDTLRQLKEMLDAGALTPTEFEALKKRLVFADQTTPPSTSSSTAPTPPAPSSPPSTPPEPEPAPPAPSPFTTVPPTPVVPASSPFPPLSSASVPPTPVTPAPSGYEPPVPRPFEPPAARPEQQIITELRSPNLGGPSPTGQEGQNPPASPRPPVAGPSVPTPTPLSQLIVESLNKAPTGNRPLSPPLNPVAPPTPVGSVPPRSPEVNRVPPHVPPAPLPNAAPLADEESWTENEFPESERPKARSPLALILSIGGLLALLGLVVYLSLNRPPSERLSSTSRTAADSVATSIETGPQADPLTPAAVAEPETIRVMPTNPAPPVQRRPAPPRRDTVAVAPAAPAASDSTDTP